MGQYEQRLKRFDEETQALSTDRLEEEIMLATEQVAEFELGGGALHEQLETIKGQITTQREYNNQVSAELDQMRTELHSQRGRHASLEALQQAALGKRQGAVTEWLDHHGLSEASRLAQGMEVDETWERAVETVLGHSLEAVCIDGIDPMVGMLQELEHGTVTLFDASASLSPAVNDKGASLLDKVQSNWDLSGVMAGIYTADSLEAALAMRASLAAHESVITADGIWMGASWLRVARDQDEKAGVLHREHELRELNERIEQFEEKVGHSEQQLIDGRESLHRMEEERDALQRQFNENNRQHSDLKAQLSGKQARLEQIKQRAERLQGEADEVRQQRQDAEAEIELAKARLHEALGLMEELAIRREELSQQREALSDRLSQNREQARGDRDKAHEMAMKIQAMRTELTTTEQAMERLQGQLGQLAERREALRLSLEEGDSPIQGMKEELEALLEKRVEVENRLAESRRKVEDIDHRLRELEQERVRAEREAMDIRSGLEQLRMAGQTVKVRRQTLQEQVVEAGFELQTLLDEMPEGAATGQWEQQVEHIGQKIQRLGPINLAAIEEFEQQSERKTYLDAQNADLTEALETLENAIRKIDRETRTRFKETFDKVNKGLQEKFPRLFGGGHAYLDLTGDDLLDTGVTVMARPPGKRNSTIHLLSGGEKALTAVALVFSIFDLNPSPFCMLDEVDAPLDEANVGRFCDMVKEMSEQVQFIFITHNKATMELSEHLAGVTMHEPGVSRMVAVDVNEAVELAAV